MCKGCGSRKETKFQSEICVHLEDGLRQPDCPPVLAFPEITVCLNCGLAEFSVLASDLERMRQG